MKLLVQGAWSSLYSTITFAHSISILTGLGNIRYYMNPAWALEILPNAMDIGVFMASLRP